MGILRATSIVVALAVLLAAAGCGSASKEGPKVMPKKFPGQGASSDKGAPSGPPVGK